MTPWVRWVPMVAAVVLVVVTTTALARGAAAVANWGQTYAGRGEATVDSCRASGARWSNQLRCEGVVEIAGGESDRSETVPTLVVGPSASFGASTPAAGDRIRVYHEVGRPERTFPRSARTIELVRAVAGLVPLALMVTGLVFWCAGWALTRRVDRAALERAGMGVWFPARLDLQPRGLLWFGIGLLWWVVDRRIVSSALGVAGLG